MPPRRTAKSAPARRPARKPAARTTRAPARAVNTSYNKSSYRALPAAKAMMTVRNSMLMSSYAEVERIAPVLGSVAFQATSIAINPALPAVFPWVALHATLYDKYRFKKLVFRFKTTRGSNSPGNMILSFDSDVMDPVATSALEMSQSAKYADGPVWSMLTLSVPCDKEWRFTRSGVVANTDQKTYDLGRLTVATEGCADALAHGYIEVDYILEVKHKQSLLAGGVSQFTNRTVLEAFNINSATISTTPTPLVFPSVSNPLNAVAQGAGGYLLKAGSYLVNAFINDGIPGGATQAILELLVGGVKIATGSTGNPLIKLITLAVDTIVTPQIKSASGTLTLGAANTQLVIQGV